MKCTILIIGCIFFGCIIFCYLISICCGKKLKAWASNTEVSNKSIPTLDKDDYWKVLSLWSENRSHYHTLNGFYLAGCTILLAAIVQLYTSPENNVLILLLLALLGTIISVQWFIATWRQVTQLEYQAKLLNQAENSLDIKLMSAWGKYHSYDYLWERKSIRKFVSRFAFIVGGCPFGMRMRIIPLLFLSIFIYIFFKIY